MNTNDYDKDTSTNTKYTSSDKKESIEHKLDKANEYSIIACSFPIICDSMTGDPY